MFDTSGVLGNTSVLFYRILTATPCNIISGYFVAVQNGVKLSSLTMNDLVRKVFGQSRANFLNWSSARIIMRKIG